MNNGETLVGGAEMYRQYQEKEREITAATTVQQTAKEIYDFLESLTDDQFQKISHFFDTLPALKHDIELKCPNKAKSKNKSKDKKDCGYTEQLTLEGLGSFFA